MITLRARIKILGLSPLKTIGGQGVISKMGISGYQNLCDLIWYKNSSMAQHLLWGVRGPVSPSHYIWN